MSARWRWGVVLGLVLAVVATAVVVVLVRDRDGAEVGSVFDSIDEVSGTELAFDLPPGRFVVTVSEPGRTVDLDPFNPTVPTEAAAGSSYVGVTSGWPDLPAAQQLRPRVTLVADGRAFALEHVDSQLTRDRQQATVAVVVPGEAPDLTVAVEYDGYVVTGDVATGEVAAGLSADLDERTEETTLDPFARDRRLEGSGDPLSATVVRTTYLPELGWVSDPQTRFVVATVEGYLGDFVDFEGGRRTASYRPTDLQVEVTLPDGGESIDLAGRSGRQLLLRRVWIVDADDPAPVEVASTVSLRRYYGDRGTPRSLVVAGGATIES